MNHVSARRDHRRFAVDSALITLVFVALLAFAARAQAATENIYWDNYKASPQTVSVAEITGSGGGTLNGSDIVKDPEGMTFDSATGRLYVASSSGGPLTDGQIVWINVDGTGAGVLSTPGAEVNEPYGVDIDPTTRIIYWANSSGGEGNKGSIGWARLDGTGGGLLNTTGVTVDDPYKVAVDLATGRLYWGNNGNTIAFANLNNSGGGGTLDLTGAPALTSLYAVAVDAAAGRVYWLESSVGKEHLGFASVNGGGGGEISLTGLPFVEPYGLSIDSSIGRIYWANYSNNENHANAIGFANLGGGGGGITPVTALVNGPQDPVILKSPTGTGVPSVTRDKKTRSKLTCSQGSWAADAVGSFFFQAPRTFAYQWTKNAKPIGGATAATYNAKSAGSYGCIVTAANQAGSATQTSKGLNVKAAKLKLSTKKKANAKPGKVVSFKVKATNQGDVQSGNAKVCVKLPGSAKGALKAPKCKSLGKLKGQAKKSATLKIKVLPSADGTYKIKFQVKGASGKAAKAKIVVG